jgi:branched-chain amino acid transport system substrate-binding protein
MLAELELAKELGVPDMSAGASNSQITALHYPVAFSTVTGDDFKGGLFAKFFKLNNFKRVAIVIENTDYGTGVIKATQAAVKAMNVPVTFNIQLFHVPATDLTPQLLQVKAFKPDVIINAGSGQDVDTIIDQTSQVGMAPSVVPQVVAYDQPTEQGWWQKHAKDGVGLYYEAIYSPSQKLSTAGDWAKTEFQKRQNAPIDFNTLNAFGEVVTIADALNQGKSTDPATLIKTLETGSFESWIATPATFPQADGSAWHHFQVPLLIVHITQANQPWDQNTLITSFGPGVP